MMLERGLTVDHTTVYRWILAYAPDLDKRCRAHLKPTNDSWRVDETYIKVKGEWKYRYRAVDSEDNTLDFMLSAKRDARAAQRFFRLALKSSHNQEPRVINVDKSAAYPPAIDELIADQTLTKTTELRPVKYLNPLLSLRGQKNTMLTLNLRYNHELCDRLPILSFKLSCCESTDKQRFETIMCRK